MRTHAFYLTNTGAEITLALGFKPDFVKITNIVTGIKLEWNRCLLNNAAAYAGIKTVANGTRSLLTAGTGVALYTGGAKVSTSAAAVQSPVFTNPASLKANQRSNEVPNLAAAPVGQTLLDGIVLSEITDINKTSEFCLVEIGQWDGD